MSPEDTASPPPAPRVRRWGVVGGIALLLYLLVGFMVVPWVIRRLVVGQSRARLHTRSWPYATAVEFRLGSSTGTLLGTGSTVATGQAVWVGVKVTQTTGTNRLANARVLLDRDRATTYDWDSGD